MLYLAVSGHQRAWGGHLDGYPRQVGLSVSSDGGTLLGGFTVDDLDDFFRSPNSEYPWQVGIDVSRDGVHENWSDLVSLSRSHDGNHSDWIDVLSLLHSRDGGYENWSDLLSTDRSPGDGDHSDWINLVSVSHSIDDGDLDLFLVNAPGGDSFVHVIGVLTAVHVPEPSTFALVLLAALGIPFRTRIAQKRSGC